MSLVDLLANAIARANIRVRALSCALFALAFSSQAATVTFTLTNSVGVPDTNYIVIKAVNPHANADGSYQTIGVPFRIYPNTSGFVSTNLQNGTYTASNAFIVSTFAQPGSGGTLQGMLFNVDNTTNTYAFTRYLRSGYNIYNWYLGITGIGGTNGFTIVTNGDGTVTLDGNGFSVTSNQIYNAFGFLPLTPPQTTNAIALATNGFQPIVFTNVGQVLYTNYLPGLTNKFTTTNYAVGVSNTLRALIDAGGASQTNGYTTLVFTNPAAVINTNQIAGVTNRMLLTNDSRAFTLQNDLNRVGNLTASIITNNSTVMADGAVGGFWIIKTNSGGLGILDTTDSGTFTFHTDGTFESTGNILAGGNVRGDAIYSDNGGFFGDGHSVTNINPTNLTAGLFIQNTNLYHIITSNEFNTTTWFLATNRDGGNAVFATNLTAGITNQWRTDATNTSTYYSNLLALIAIAETNGFKTIVYSNPSVYMHTNLLPALTNLLATSNALYAASNFLYTTPPNAIANLNGIGTNTSLNDATLTNNGTLFIISTNIQGGVGNTVSSGDINTIILGRRNFVGPNDVDSVIIGGTSNRIGDSVFGTGVGNIILGGSNNVVTSNALYNIAGGVNNKIGGQLGAGGTPFGYIYGNVALGIGNTIATENISASYGTFAFGISNHIAPFFFNPGPANTNVFVLGRFGSSSNNDSFLWSDGSQIATTFTTNTFIISSKNGVGINTNFPSNNGLAVHGTISGTNYTIQGDQIVIQNTNHLEIYNAGTAIANGGDYQWDSTAGQYTNYNTGSMVSNNAIVWIIKNSSFASLYTSQTLISSNWTPVAGVLASPIVSYGAIYKEAGEVHEGYFNSTNVYDRVTNTVTGTLANSVPIFNRIIYVSTNEIDGLNHALTNLVTSTNKMYAGGGKIVLQHGVHYITTAMVYSNQFPSAVTIEGEVKPGVSVVYVGPSTNANIFRFMGNQVGEGCLLQLRIKGVDFSSIYDNTNWLLQVQGLAHAEIEGCQFIPWTIATNNSSRGIAVAESDVSTRFTNLGGLYLAPGDTGVGLSVRDSGFQWLQNGLYDGTDHILVENCYFSLIGGGPSGSAINTGWPTNSIFRLGAAIIRDSTPGAIGQTLYHFNHFTRDNICLLNNDSAMVNKSMAFCRLEDCTYRYVSLKSGNGFTLYSCNNASSSSPDGLGGIVGTTYSISNAVPVVKSFGEDDQIASGNLVMYPARSYGLRVDATGNSYLTGTNKPRAIYQLVNLDTGYFRIAGCTDARVNGTYLFKEQDQSSTSRDNWRTVWTNTVGTNVIIYDPAGGLAWGAYDSTNDPVENVLYFNESTSNDPPPTSWDQNLGTDPTITVNFIYGKFKADPVGNVSGFSLTVNSNLFVAGPTYITNTITILTNLSAALPALPGGAGLLWNSNADLYWVSAAPFGTTRTTNLIKAH